MMEWPGVQTPQAIPDTNFLVPGGPDPGHTVLRCAPGGSGK